MQRANSGIASPFDKEKAFDFADKLAIVYNNANYGILKYMPYRNAGIYYIVKEQLESILADAPELSDLKNEKKNKKIKYIINKLILFPDVYSLICNNKYYTSLELNEYVSVGKSLGSKILWKLLYANWQSWFGLNGRERSFPGMLKDDYNRRTPIILCPPECYKMSEDGLQLQIGTNPSLRFRIKWRQQYPLEYVYKDGKLEKTKCPLILKWDYDRGVFKFRQSVSVMDCKSIESDDKIVAIDFGVRNYYTAAISKKHEWKNIQFIVINPKTYEKIKEIDKEIDRLRSIAKIRNNINSDTKQIKKLRLKRDCLLSDMEHKVPVELFKALKEQGIENHMIVAGNLTNILKGNNNKKLSDSVEKKINRKLYQIWRVGKQRHNLKCACENKGYVLKLINEHGTTHGACPYCGDKNVVELANGRKMMCKNCRRVLPRDIWGSLNIKAKYEGSFGETHKNLTEPDDLIKNIVIINT